MSDPKKSDTEEKPSVSEKPSKSGGGSSCETRPNVYIFMQNDLFSDLLSTLNEIKASGTLSKIVLQTYRASIDADFENATKYNKSILGSTKLSDEARSQYSESRIYKSIKDTYWQIVTEISIRLEAFTENQVPEVSTKKMVLKKAKLFNCLRLIYLPFQEIMMNGRNSIIFSLQVFIIEQI